MIAEKITEAMVMIIKDMIIMTKMKTGEQLTRDGLNQLWVTERPPDLMGDRSTEEYATSI